jgi:GT2 family glycosyltransferase
MIGRHDHAEPVAGSDAGGAGPVSATTTPEDAAARSNPEHPARRLTAVVCAYTLERWEDIKAAVDSLRSQTRSPAQVILVSDHNPELLERARQAFPGVTCIPSNGPRGLSGARNTGVAAATGDVIAFLDDDATADSRWAERLLDAYRDEDVIGVGGTVLPAWRAHRPAWFPDEFLWVVGCSYEGLPRTCAEVRNPIGANMSFRREVFDRAGPFDVAIGRLGKDAAGCEETEFSIRARRARPRGRIVVEPGAVCWHSVTPERVTRRYFRQRCRAEGRSKALVSRLAGAESALSSERVYVRRTLPRGLLRGLRDLLRGDPSGASRAWAIVEGLTLTVFGYVTGRLRPGSTAPL